MIVELIVVLGVAVVAGLAGLAIGILLIGPRLNRWAEQDDEEADGERD